MLDSKAGVIVDIPGYIANYPELIVQFKRTKAMFTKKKHVELADAINGLIKRATKDHKDLDVLVAAARKELVAAKGAVVPATRKFPREDRAKSFAARCRKQGRCVPARP